METKQKAKRTAKIQENRCVACGCCEKACPKGAVTIVQGVKAVVDKEKCVGCGLCAKACPASVVTMEARA